MAINQEKITRRVNSLPTTGLEPGQNYELYLGGDVYRNFVVSDSRRLVAQDGKEFIECDTVDDLRNLDARQIWAIQNGYYKGVTLNGYYKVDDTPASIDYYLSDTTEADDGGSVFEIGSIKLETKQANNVDYFGAMGDGTHDDTDVIQKAYNSTLKYGYEIEHSSNKEYFITNIEINHDIKINYNGCKIKTKQFLDGTSNGMPAFLFKGSTITSHIFSGGLIGSDRIVVETIESEEYSIGDIVYIRDSTPLDKWDEGTAGFGYHEINTIKSINIITGELELTKPLDWNYIINPTIYKVNTITPIIRNGPSIQEIDSGGAVTEQVNGYYPDIFHFHFCKSPVIYNASVNGFNKHFINFNRCYMPMIVGCFAENAFRQNIGGHGYLCQFQYSFGGKNIRSKGRNLRHLNDCSYSIECGSIECFDENFTNNGASFFMHGLKNKRCFSQDDEVLEGLGWGVGNVSFRDDEDIRIINPKYRSSKTATVFSFSTYSKNITIINPNIYLHSGYIYLITSGAENIKAIGGKYEIYGASGTRSFIVTRDTPNATGDFGAKVKNVYFDDFEATGHCLVSIRMSGDLKINNYKFLSTSDLITTITIQEEIDNLIISNGTAFGYGSKFLRVNVPPVHKYDISDNTLMGNNPITLESSKNLRLLNNKFPESTSLTFNGDLDNSKIQGAILFGNTINNGNKSIYDLPAISETALSKVYNQRVYIPNSNGSSSQLEFSRGDIYSNGSLRWLFRLVDDETGVDGVGTNIQFLSRNNDGSARNSIFSIDRETGTTRFSSILDAQGTYLNPLKFNNGYLWVNSTGVWYYKQDVNTLPASDTDGVLFNGLYPRLSTAQRTALSIPDNITISVYDTNLNKPLWGSGSGGTTTWVDATGTTV